MVNNSAQKVTEIAAASQEQSAQAGEVMESVQYIAATSEEAAAQPRKQRRPRNLLHCSLRN